LYTVADLSGREAVVPPNGEVGHDRDDATFDSHQLDVSIPVEATEIAPEIANDIGRHALISC
jgi:hypothetical protein